MADLIENVIFLGRMFYGQDTPLIKCGQMSEGDMPTKKEFANNERQAIIDVDGGVPPFLCGENEGKGYPIPLDEETFARDERTAIVEFDGGGRDDFIENVIRIFQGRYAQAR